MSEQRNDLELIQYYIVNTDLEMSKGKTAAQCCHGSMLIALRDYLDIKFQIWMNNMKKVVLSGTLKQIHKIKEQIPDSILIKDKGFTEIEPGSETVLVLPIMTREESRKYVGRLRLLK